MQLRNITKEIWSAAGHKRGIPVQKMMPSVWIVVITSLISLRSCTGQSSNVHYSIIASKYIRPSSVYNVTVTCYNANSDVNLTLRLQDFNSNVLTEKQVIQSNEVTQIIGIEIPDTVPYESYILVSIGSGGLSFRDSSYVYVKRKTLSIFVQTDKAMYKPGQKVLFRAVVVYPDLKPYQGLIDVTIFDKSENIIMQWLRQRNDSGVISQSLQLSDLTPVGVWKIVVTAEANTQTKTFEVAEYVLPKFEATINAPSYYLINLNRRDLQKDLLFTVTARYTYDQPVKGRANISVQLTPSIYDYYDQSRNKSKIIKDVQLIDGKADISVRIEELLVLINSSYYYESDPWTALSYRSILIGASVNETLTGVIRSANASIPCRNNKYQLKILNISPSNYKPGLPYNAYLRLTQVDGSLPDLGDITSPGGSYRTIYVQATMKEVKYELAPVGPLPPACLDHPGSPGCVSGCPPGIIGVPGPTGPREPSGPSRPGGPFGCIPGPSTVTRIYELGTHRLNVTVDTSGYAAVSFVIDSNATTVSLEVSFYVEATNSTVMDSKTLNAYMSRDKQGLQVLFNSSDGILKAMKEALFIVNSTDPITTFHYELLGKGSILMSGNISGNSSRQHSFSIFISKNLAMKLAPTARIIVWFLTTGGEIIADSTQFSVEDSLANEVSLSFDRNSTIPSENVTLTVNAFKNSSVFVLAVDQSVILLQGGNDITPNLISDDLMKYDSIYSSNNYDTYYRVPMPCFYWCYPYYIEGTTTKDILNNAGVVIMTDGYLYTEPPTPQGPIPGAPGPIGPPGEAGQPGATRLPATILPTRAGPEPGLGNNIPDDTSKTRTRFPETFIWVDEAIGPDGHLSFTASVPDTITSWVASAFAVSQVAGLGVTRETAELTVFKQFFISPNLPYSVIRGEQFALGVNVMNYLSDRLNVIVTVQQSNYFKIQGGWSKTAVVESNDATAVYFWIIPEALGQIPIHISAQTPVAGDSIIATLLVKPEGIKQEYSTSILLRLVSNTSTYNSTFDVSIPPAGQLVPGSEQIQVTLGGDMLVPSIKGLGQLLALPYGCGEQNMVKFAPDVFILRYLSASNQLTEDVKSKALSYILSGYQRELTYQRNDGSFSCFGETDRSGSMWLSSFVIKCFHQARDFISVDEKLIAKAMRWIINQQASNGSFAEPPFGRSPSSYMKGGLSEGVPMTAFVLNALLETRDNQQISRDDVTNSISMAIVYLENQLTVVSSDPYALSIVSYALARANSSKVNEALQMLDALAIVEGGTKHWERANDQSDTGPTSWVPPYRQAKAIDIEMSSYVLLTYSYLNQFSNSLSVAKWIVTQRNSNGGFSSTQDTVLALEALSQFAELMLGPSSERNLQVSIATSLIQHDFLPITDETSVILQSYDLPTSTRKIFNSASGIGSAVLQLNVKYNIYQTVDNSGIQLNVNTTQDGNNLFINSCSSWEKRDDSGMVIMEVNQLTGFKASDVQSNTVYKKIENTDDKVTVYFDKLSSNKTCVIVTSSKVYRVTNVQDAPVKVYPYYNPVDSRTQFYSAPQTLGNNDACQECPLCCQTNRRTTPAQFKRTTMGRSQSTTSSLPVNSRRMTPSKPSL